VEYVIYTGDSVSHASWVTSVETNEKMITFVLDEIRNAFPGKLILPLLGNHEAHPSNV
jgi:sphingomyelin phosphodiesterase